MTQKLKTYGWVSFIFSFWWSFYINLMVHHHRISLPLFSVRNVYATAQCQESAIRNLSATAQCQESLCHCSVSGISLPMLSVRNLPSGISLPLLSQESLCHCSVSGISLPLFSVRNFSAIVQCQESLCHCSMLQSLHAPVHCKNTCIPVLNCWLSHLIVRNGLWVWDYEHLLWVKTDETMSTFYE